MDSPSRSEKLAGDTRYSTPVSDLDDHRNHEPIPAADPEVMYRRESIVHQAGERRGTTGSVRPPPTILLPPSPYNGPIARDFEQALADDDANETLKSPAESKYPTPSRQWSYRSRAAVGDDEKANQNEDAMSSRSSSPPNSVDAFAEPRRRERANTFGSREPTDFQQLERTVSGGTHRRRPTFTTGSVRDLPVDDHNNPEDDVCFPQENQPSKWAPIDYEAIEEFVAEHRRPDVDAVRSRRHSYTSAGRQGANTSLHLHVPPLEVVGAPSDPFAILDKPDSEKTTVGVPRDEIVEKLNEIDSGRKDNVSEDQRFSFFSTEIEQTIHVAEMGDLVMRGESFRDLFELPGESGAWWLDIMNPTEDEIDMCQKAFGIHRLTAEDIEKQETREKVELFKQYYFVSFRSFVMDPSKEEFLDPIMIYMVVFREGILTFSYASNPHASHVRKRIGKLRNFINLTGDWICYALVDDIVDCFAPSITDIERETDQIEDQVFTLRAEDSIPLLRNIGECRKKVTSLMRLLGGKADVIKGFAKRCNEQYSMTPRHEIGLYLGDIQDHVVTMMSNLVAFEKMLSRSHANYLAHLSVDNLIQGNKANAVLSKITIVATILVPMNLITGLFGMNVPVPGRETESLQWFFGILGIILAFVVFGLGIAKKARFI